MEIRKYNIGDTIFGRELGYKFKKYIWVSCELCGKERWVQYRKTVNIRKKCLACSHRGKNHDKASTINGSNIGEIKYGLEIGYKSNSKYIWIECKNCGHCRWVQCTDKRTEQAKCRKCVQKGRQHTLIARQNMSMAQKGKRCMEKHSNWKGGRVCTGKGRGYMQIMVASTDFFFPMASQTGYVLEHRLVMAKSLGRCLETWEIVHHRNGIRDDNRLENLQLHGCQGEHNTQIQRTLINQAKQIKELQERVIILESENVLLRGNSDEASQAYKEIREKEINGRI